MARTAALASFAQIRRLGFAWPPSAAAGTITDEHAVRVGVQLDLEATIESLRSACELARRERSASRSVAAQWNAPLGDVTDRDDDHGERILFAGEAIRALEKICARVRQTGPLPELEEDRVEASRQREQLEAHLAAPRVDPAPTPPDPSPILRALPVVPEPAAPRAVDGGPLPAPLAPTLFEPTARTLVRALGLAWPDDVRSVVRRDVEPEASITDTETTWSHGGVTVSIGRRVETHAAMGDSADRWWRASISGLPGGCCLRFQATRDVFDRFTLTGDDARRPEVARTLATVFGGLIRARSHVAPGILAPEGWCERAAMVDLGRLARVLRVHRWALEPLDPAGDGGWFAVAVKGEVGGAQGVAVDPIGPLPPLLGIAYVTATRTAQSPEKAPPSIEQLGEVLAGVAPPSAPEKVRQIPGSPHRERRFRVGPWVFQDAIYATSQDKVLFEMRVQSEEGGPHAAIVSGAYNPKGWGDLTIEVIGDPASRAEVGRRLTTWASASGWTLVLRWEAEPE